MRHDSALRITITARADTSKKGKSRNLKLAAERLDAVRSYLVNKLKIEQARVATATAPLVSGEAASTVADVIRTDLSGRNPAVFGKPETVVLPPATDERTQRADSLTTGAVTSPFLYKGYYTIVRLNAREQARRKTYEEAGPELSSAYQDYESKRLESDWLSQLRQKFPVVENKTVLKNAFAPVQLMTFLPGCSSGRPFSCALSPLCRVLARGCVPALCRPGRRRRTHRRRPRRTGRLACARQGQIHGVHQRVGCQ